jgi:hypothetical protein
MQGGFEMIKFISLFILTLLLSVSAFAHQAFTLVSSEKKTIKESELAALEKNQTVGKKEGVNLTFTEGEIRLVVITGPEDDMLSYRIQGVRNPNLAVPGDVTLKILFVNVDGDMRHDIRFGHKMDDFQIAPDTAETAGSEKLTAKGEGIALPAEELVLKSNEDGAYKYFCSVRGHAKGGMWGNVLVGVKPGADFKMPEKTTHVHSPDEDKDHQELEKKEESKEHEHTEKKDDPNQKNQKSHEHTPGMEMKDNKSDMPGMNHSTGSHNMEMKAVTDIASPMNRESSGTAWVPDSSPMYAKMKMYEDGSMLMLHGTVFLRYKSIGSSRNVSIAGNGSRQRFDAPSMFMAMYSKPLSEKSQIGLRAMISLDPIIERGYGYPLLYQSGELYKGQQLHDRQHPHDFFSELSATYSYKLNDRTSVYLYAGYPGEPALGPPAYVHRVSAMNNPDAPIGHHWQDATHITWGVLTAGVNFGKFKFETSAFKGTEPDENRWNFDTPKLNSFSARVSFNPTKEWAFQISHGYIRNPEPSKPEIRIMRRTTASAIFNKRFDENRNWASSFVWGQNYAEGERSNSFLFESNYDFGKNAVFGRLEEVQKNSHELALPAPHPEGNFWVAAYSLGFIRDLYKNKAFDVGLGAMGTFNTNPSIISSFYGGTKHGGWQVFIRLRPSKIQ